MYLLGDDIFEYDKKNSYSRHKNVGKTSEFDWTQNFEKEGKTKISPNELEEKIIELKKNMMQLLIIVIVL